ncbi:MAG: glycosyltransferase family 4 protein [Candidatus Thorarchaeota archaeon]
MSDTTRNILLLNSIERTVWGGLEHWMEMIGQGLARHGHTVRIAGREGSQFLRRLSESDDFEVIPMEISGDFNPFTIKALADMIRRNRPDVMLCNFVKDVRLAGLARTLSEPFKIIWTPGVNLAKKSLSHKWLFSNFVDHVIVPSEHLRNEIMQSGYISSSSFSVIPVGIDASLWQGDRDESRAFLLERFNLPEDAFICLTSGRFVPQKGHYHLIEAARALVDRCGHIFFLLLGDGPLEAELVEQIRRYNLTDRFVFCGLLEKHQKAVFGADVYVHPAVIEPYGIVLVEAMAAGLPVVATKVGGIPEVVEENETALLVDAADPGQLTGAVERFYTDESLRKSYGRSGYERCQRMFRMESMIDRIESALQEVAGK